MEGPVDDVLSVYPRAGRRHVYRSALRAFLDLVNGPRRGDRVKAAGDVDEVLAPGTSPTTATVPPT